MIILVTYDLNKSSKNYMPLFQAIKNISGTWWHSLTSVWLVKTDLSPAQIKNILLPHVDSNDELFVVRVTSDYAGYLGPEARQWLASHMNS
ncbi:MAG: hypothetical protein AAB461_01195 [Patescibacteria group bacterium]